jgi:hypothetical protein
MLLTHHLLRETPPGSGALSPADTEVKGRRVAPDGDLARGRAELKALVLTLSTAVRGSERRGRKPTATGPAARILAMAI